MLTATSELQVLPKVKFLQSSKSSHDVFKLSEKTVESTVGLDCGTKILCHHLLSQRSRPIGPAVLLPS